MQWPGQACINILSIHAEDYILTRLVFLKIGFSLGPQSCNKGGWQCRSSSPFFLWLAVCMFLVCNLVVLSFKVMTSSLAFLCQAGVGTALTELQVSHKLPRMSNSNNNTCSSLQVLPFLVFMRKWKRQIISLFLAIRKLVFAERPVLSGSLVVMMRTTCSQHVENVPQSGLINTFSHSVYHSSPACVLQYPGQSHKWRKL